MWLISSWEENKFCWKLSKGTKLHLFYSKLSKLSFWVTKVVILLVTQLVTTVIFFSAWYKSCVKWDNSQNSTQKMRTSESLVLVVITALVVGAQFFIGLATESWMIYLGRSNYVKVQRYITYNSLFLISDHI